MDKNVLKRIKKIRKPFTQELVDGWCKTDLEDVDVYYDKCLRYILKSLEEKGFFFDGIERVCPLEFFEKITKGNEKTSKKFEATQTSFFGVKFKSHYIHPITGVRTNLKEPYTFLPFTNKYGDVFVRNSIYSLQMVLSERGPSVDGNTDKTVFIRVLVNKSKISSESFDFYKVRKVSHNNISQLPLNVRLPASRFYTSRNDRKVSENATPYPLLAWYVFAKYGFKEAMKRYACCDYRIDTKDVLVEECPESEGWEIVGNGNDIYSKCIHKDVYSDIDLAIAIKTNSDTELTSLPYQYAASFLFASAVMGGMFDATRIDTPRYWRLLIGYCSINLPGNTDEEVYLRQMDEHVSSVEEYADPFTISRWNKSNIEIKDTYDLFNHLISHYTEIIVTYEPANMLHKELACKEFLLENLIRSANDFKFKLRNKPSITPSAIEKELATHFNLFGIDASIRNNNAVLEQTGTDNPFIDYGLGIIRQTKATVSRNSNSKKEDFDANHPSILIDASQLVVVSYQYSTNPHPAGDGMLLPRVCLKNGKYVALHDSDIEMYQEAVKRLSFG